MVRFAILGPIRAWHDDTELELGSRQQRLILALLLARAGQPVSAGELVDLLWETGPPASAANVVHRHIGLLRRVLEPGLPLRSAGSYLHRDDTFYRLRLDGAALDLADFRELSAAGRYPEALRLWQGRCADGLDPVTRLHPAFLGVDTECLRVVRNAADAALLAGPVAPVLPALRLATELEPLDEALQARLLLVLGADGRQSEALAAFHDFRGRLVRELGVAPGVELKEAYDRLLHQRAAPVVPEKSTDPAVPAQLPSDHPYFTGRGEILAAAERLLRADRDEGRPATALHLAGMPGTGKTTVAIHLAHRLAERYPDGQLYADLRGFDAAGAVPGPAEVLRAFLGALGVPPSGLPAELHALAGLFRSILARRRMLILLDNCRDWQQIRHLLPGTGDSLVITTSRRTSTGLLAIAGAHPLPLGPLTTAEARELLDRRLGTRRVAADPRATDEVIDRCGRLPLALALVATRALSTPGLSLAALANELGPAGLDDVFAGSYRALSPAAATMFRLLPGHPATDFSTEAVASLCGVPVRAARSQLLELTAYLLVRPSRNRWGMHALLRAYAAGFGERQDDRLYDHYLLSAYAAHRTLQPTVHLPEPVTALSGITPETFGGSQESLAWFAAEQDVLTALIGRAATGDRPGFAWRAALMMQVYFQHTGRIAEWAETMRTGLTAAERDDDRTGRAHLHRALAGALYFSTDFAGSLAHLIRARGLFEELGLPADQGHTENNLALLRHEQKQYEDAIRHGQAAAALFEGAGEQTGVATALTVIGRSRAERGQHAESIRLFEQARQHYEAAGDEYGIGNTFDMLGHTYRLMGDLTAAVRNWEHAADCYRRAGAGAAAADALIALGDARRASGDEAGARHDWAEAAELHPPVREALQERLPS
jgi:DNA-binding SARP family transcriptional activator/tetratricopeptide (TPR) repeat protein